MQIYEKNKFLSQLKLEELLQAMLQAGQGSLGQEACDFPGFSRGISPGKSIGIGVLVLLEPDEGQSPD
jgi:hypothetical protein